MTTSGDNTPLGLFKALQSAFNETIRSRRSHPDFVSELSVLAFNSFDGNVAIQIESMPDLACHDGCAACCNLRVAASAPEILLIARFIVATQPAFAKIAVDLGRRVGGEDAITRSLTEKERLELRRPCPFIEDGLCLIYRARPLACRGHASFDKRACGDAVTGSGGEAQISVPHFLVRSIVQNAMLAALRDTGLSWRLYELNAAVNFALSNPDAETNWLEGSDPFFEAAIREVDAEEMAKTFDAIKSRKPTHAQ